MSELETREQFIDDEYRNEFLERMEEWLAEIDTARREVVELEMALRALYARGAIDECELDGLIDRLTNIYVGLARGKQTAKWCRKYPPAFGEKYPL